MKKTFYWKIQVIKHMTLEQKKYYRRSIQKYLKTSESEPKVNYRLWMIMMCRYRSILGNKCTFLVSDLDNSGGYICVRCSVYRKSLYLPLNFVVNLKLHWKIKSKNLNIWDDGPNVHFYCKFWHCVIDLWWIQPNFHTHGHFLWGKIKET